MEVVPIHVGDLVFASGRWLQAASDLNHLVVVEVQARNGVARLGSSRLLLQRDRLARGIELDYPVRTRFSDPIGEDCSAVNVGKVAQLSTEPLAIEDVVAENKRHLLGTDEVRADHERLRQPTGLGLFCVADRDAELRSVTEQSPEGRRVLWGRDYQHLVDAGEDQ